MSSSPCHRHWNLQCILSYSTSTSSLFTSFARSYLTASHLSNFQHNLQGTMRPIFVSIFLLAYFANVAVGSEVEGFKKLFIESMTTAVKCHPGFKKLPDRMVEAAETCAKKEEINNYMCYLTCMYRQYGYIKPGTNEIDFTIGDIVTMEAFDLETPEGRTSYWDIALHRYECGRDYSATKTAFFATKYDDGKSCSRARTFFKCQVLKTLFCGAKSDQTKAVATQLST